ncbi:hypothetical protein SCACP_30590 [Sporomusa carbonis]|uniref:helix-turn-helix domain-containing protein n=1 Tax=Sporomusa carbonis TaxID=3076075 RepID=UPI003A6A70F8
MSEKTDYTDVGSRLREIREKSRAKKISQNAFGEQFGVSQSYIKNVESGSKPSLEFLINVATAYDVSLDWLLLGREPGEHQYQQLPGRVNRSNEQESDPDLKEWISFFYSVPPDARPLLIGTVRTLLQNSYAPSNPNNAPSTLPNTGGDEHAAAKSDIA